MVFGSLFSGCGGLDLGLERAGMTVAWQVELDGWRRSILARHWPDVRRHDDVATFPPGRPDDWRVDLICGGDPCQGNSKGGGGPPATGEGPAHHFIRVVGLLRPRLVLRENPASTRSDAPWPWHRFRSELESLGYAVLPFRLRACCLGLDHQRERLFLLGALPDAVCPGLEGTYPEVIEHGDAARCDRRRSAPRLCRRADGLPRRVDRMKALGNAVPPVMAEWIGRRIMEAERRPVA
jgi:DNA (cytosine-5)-methyltransferase 1